MVPLLQQGMLCRRKSRVLLPGALSFPASACPSTLGATSLLICLWRHSSLPLMQASVAPPMGSHATEDSHLVW